MGQVYTSQWRGWQFFYNHDNSRYYIQADTTEGIQITNSYFNCTQHELNRWYHVALTKVRSGINHYYRLFIDGEQQDSTKNDPGLWNNYPYQITIGKIYTSGRINAYIDEFRVSNESARWTSNFTPPSYPYCSSIHKVGGTANDSAKLLIIDQDTWKLETMDIAPGSYDCGATTSGNKIIAAVRSDGEVVSYGNVNHVSTGTTDNNGTIE